MTAYETLSRGLLPWLEAAFEQFEQALENGHLGHAWLISGPAGIGKINLALALANRLLGSTTRPRALGVEAALEALRERHAPADRHPDLQWLHPEEDKETISVDQVRGVIETLGLTAHQGETKVVIVEPAEALTTAAANALLKTLEEPTGGSCLLLVCHRPGRLPATVRSRCQHQKLHAPDAEATARWLEVDAATLAGAQRLVGRAPLAVAEFLKEKSIDINALEGSFVQLCEDKLDCQSLAQIWHKEGARAPLAWLGQRLHEEVRRRFAPSGSNGVTVPGSAALHNAWRGLSTRTLIEQYDRSEKLLNQLGSGVNVELAIQAMLSAFQRNRG